MYEVNDQLMSVQQTDSINRRTLTTLATTLDIYDGDLSYHEPTQFEHPIGMPPQIAISEAYKQFLNDIARGRQFNHFYKQLITLRKDILLDISNRNQGIVARELNINPVKMSAIVAMLKEIDSPQYHVTNRLA